MIDMDYRPPVNEHCFQNDPVIEREMLPTVSLNLRGVLPWSLHVLQLSASRSIFLLMCLLRS